MKTKFIFLALALLLVLPMMVSSQQNNLGTFPQNSCINLIQTCSNCSFNNITSISRAGQNSSVLLTNVQMSKLGTYYNYTFCDTSSQGIYTVTGFGDLDGINTIWNYIFTVNATGQEFSGMMVSVYIFFLLICLLIIFLSIRLTINNPMGKDELTKNKLYDMKKRDEVKFYLELLKKKMWIIGVFGIYLSVLAFLAFLSQLIFSLGIHEMVNLLNSIVVVLAWGLIPFIIFWIAYLIIFFYTSTVEILKYQFGGFRDPSKSGGRSL